ncbi:UvrD-helicase domain-containing protein [Nocardia zapadnayensis]|uniref:UvrD-helicase domain-containing protein n=1 Tax=Nocardia rhamnosiphila TaxID=426716 RepID=UPI0022477AD6|nr:UvrD-helicase domain-containing protein [Nocardia zapadnayensis]MCX0274241.1 UvrD-helicase domain-containing protein [Nocardia zapadnayensis]
MSGATLRMLDKAYDQIMKLPRPVKGAIYDFQHKFRNDPTSTGLRFKQLKVNSPLYSARVNDDYRALLLHAGKQDYVIVAVKPRQEVYDNLDRYRYQINPVSGGIEFVDLVSAETVVPEPEDETPTVTGLFEKYSTETLLELGVAEPLLPLIAKLTTEDELQALISYAPQLTGEVLLELFVGKTPEEVMEQVTTPVAAAEPIDTQDYQSALGRSATVTTADTALQEVLEGGDFQRWKTFLHPTQRTIVERDYKGPARVSGGPGTGKTIVALHRVVRLVRELEPGGGQDILLTTFNTNLAADLRQRLIDLGGPEVLDRVDIIPVDKLAGKVVAESSGGPRRRAIQDVKAVEEWRQLLLEEGVTEWDPEFLHDEWTEVILGQGVVTRAQYFKARRSGRGRRIGRESRAAIWRLVELYVQRLDAQQVWTFRQVSERAAQLETERVRNDSDAPRRYRHIVVDEAQDLDPTHWRLLRAMVAEGRNDLFIAGDTHQRLYGHYVSLGQLGINIRGRSAKLTLSYRTTHEILGMASALLGEEDWDDLDEGSDDLTGFRSVLRGGDPILQPYPTWESELDGIAEVIGGWPATSVAVAVPERWMVGDVVKRLGRSDIHASVIGPDGPREVDAPVHVGTMHRFKGLEYQRMILAGVADSLVPAKRVLEMKQVDPVRYRTELKRARSLLFVAATRARDSVLISWHGKKSRFLP